MKIGLAIVRDKLGMIVHSVEELIGLLKKLATRYKEPSPVKFRAPYVMACFL